MLKMKRKYKSMKAALEGRLEYREYETNEEPRQIKPSILKIGQRALFVDSNGLKLGTGQYYHSIFLN